MMKLITLFAYLVFFSLPVECIIKAIISDAGGVLIESSKLKKTLAMLYQKPYDLIIQSIRYGGSEKLVRQRTYDVLVYAGGKQSGPYKMYDEKGNELPGLMANWQLGKITAHQVHELVDKTLDMLMQSSYFSSIHEKNFFELIIKEGIFNPKGHAQTQLASTAIPLIKKLSQEITSEGNQKYQFFILSNWDTESFAQLYNSERLQQEVFNFFPQDHIYYSGKYCLAKPDPEFFNLLCNNHNLKPEECLFIDDQSENIAAAKKLGMQTILWNKKEAKNIENMLKEIGLLSK